MAVIFFIFPSIDACNSINYFKHIFLRQIREEVIFDVGDAIINTTAGRACRDHNARLPSSCIFLCLFNIFAVHYSFFLSFFFFFFNNHVLMSEHSKLSIRSSPKI